MEKLHTSNQEDSESHLREIANRADQDARKYLKERMHLNLIEKKEVEIINPEKQVLKDNAFPIMEKAFSDLNITPGSQEQIYYLEQFTIVAGLDKPKD
ncbi:MAG: hypothetical protein AAB350_00980 [Patescibacteria group bacterium]